MRTISYWTVAEAIKRSAGIRDFRQLVALAQQASLCHSLTTWSRADWTVSWARAHSVVASVEWGATPLGGASRMMRGDGEVCRTDPQTFVNLSRPAIAAGAVSVVEGSALYPSRIDDVDEGSVVMARSGDPLDVVQEARGHLLPGEALAR